MQGAAVDRRGRVVRRQNFLDQLFGALGSNDVQGVEPAGNAKDGLIQLEQGPGADGPGQEPPAAPGRGGDKGNNRTEGIGGGKDKNKVNNKGNSNGNGRETVTETVTRFVTINGGNGGLINLAGETAGLGGLGGLGNE
jgi:hypothetical protein